MKMIIIIIMNNLRVAKNLNEKLKDKNFVVANLKN